MESVLENFIPVSPVKRSRQPSRILPMPFVPPDGSNATDNFPDFSTQSMEDLLNAEGLVGHNVQAGHDFHQGFLGFEGFSGWDGFDINNM